MYCVQNDTGVSTKITIAIGGSNYLTNTSYAYNSVGVGISSGAATGDQICYLGRDASPGHYLMASWTGTWS
jgi:hypothetical protein